MKVRLVLVVCGILGMLVAGPAFAHFTGVGSEEMIDGPATCGGSIICHGSASPDVTVTISGPDTLLAGETATYTITATGAGLQVGTGLNVAAFMGGVISDLLTAANADYRSAGPTGFELTHVNVYLSFAGVFSHQFDVTMPLDATSGIELEGALNSYDQSGTSAGDHWNRGTFAIALPEPSSAGLEAGALAALLALARVRRRR